MSAEPRKAVFDVVRGMLKRGFRQTEIGELDRALDCAAGDEESCSPISARTIGSKGIALIKQFEGCASVRADGLVEAYPDPASGGDPWTIGWGATGKGIAPGTVWTREECDARLGSDLVRYAADVDRALGGAATTQDQFDALVSFHYNTGAVGRATLTKLHVAGDYAGAAREFARWNKAAGRTLKGLSRRRAAEAALYLGN
ncbi:lysozyme [Altererythrobacter sp. ZODW24]|uniref:lysozyme n=1 Tax=Altererythrobacter sp. ZODW24 TaxID=2185142 RepID=UPI000DF854BC|nr:lysozyme [Altererythrobacter sp. ZODW24]